MHQFPHAHLVFALFNKMGALKFKSQLIIGFFPTVNHNYLEKQKRKKKNGSKPRNHNTEKFDLLSFASTSDRSKIYTL